MTNETSGLSVIEAKAYIFSIDFSQIMDKMEKTYKWKRKDLMEVCELYRHYLFLKKKYEHEDYAMPPSEDIDEFRHNHILDTKKYAVDCQKIFGRYLHHYPYLGMDEKTNDDDLQGFFETTQKLHHEEFGDYIYHVRHKLRKQIVMFFKLLFKKNRGQLASKNANPI